MLASDEYMIWLQLYVSFCSILDTHFRLDALPQFDPSLTHRRCAIHRQTRCDRQEQVFLPLAPPGV
jgi:hypothetical protein